jgi:hypothetical protein
MLAFLKRLLDDVERVSELVVSQALDSVQVLRCGTGWV